MKRTLIASAVSAAFFALPAWAVRDASEIGHVAMPMQVAQAGTPQAPQGMGPGMMGQGQGMGPGMMGQGQGMGPGMMGQGYGPGMMGQGMGPGMMGYGMMGQGMGPGMMSGMMGPGMMYGADRYASLDLSAEQRSKISAIQEQLWRKRWDLMGKMHEERYHMHRLMSGAVTDDAAARKAYQAMADAHKQMFDAMLDARKHIDALLTKEQREQLRRAAGGG